MRNHQKTNLPRYSENLALKIAAHLEHLSDVEERVMFDGLFFMVNGKICISVHLDQAMFRIEPNISGELSERSDWSEMTVGSRSIRGYIMVSETGLSRKEDLTFWISLALAFNPLAKASRRKKIV